MDVTEDAKATPLAARARATQTAEASPAQQRSAPVHAPAIVTAGSLTEGAERVALISRRLSAREVQAYFAAKRELHRRFTDDQKLGNIWYWSWRGLQLRPQVEAFLEASSLWPHESAADLADDWLGAFAQPVG